MFINRVEILVDMGKNNITKSIISVLVIIVLAVLIANVNSLISPKAANAQQQTERAGAASAKDYGECFNKEPGTIVFVHSTYCPHCQNMMPIVKGLEGEGYKFYWAESSDSEAKEIVTGCFSDILSGYVPQFICPATGKEYTGEMSKAELKMFADECA